MGTIHSLSVIGWIPVAFVEDDGVGRCQVDTQTTSSSTQKEAENVVASRIESVIGIKAVSLHTAAANL